jgi:tRNA A-37 threonylcarbamoyl transferase component Bud32
MTHTYSILDVPHAVYAAVRALLDRASYQHAFHGDADGEVIDMHGIALRSKAGPASTDITVSTLLSSQTKEGRIDFSLNGELTQMDLDKAREIVGMLQQAIEAAMTDQMLYQFLTERIKLKPEAAAAALVDFRELRQGSRDRVYPS